MRFDLARRYKRWRHGRGFGIHSPFAYDFITRTLRERMPYYAYERIDAAAHRGDGRLSSRKLRLIFRIAVRFNPSKAAVIGDANAAVVRLALKSARHNMTIVDCRDAADLYVINDDLTLPYDDRRKTVYIFPDMKSGGDAACDTLWNGVTHGMRFDSPSSFTVIVTSPTLPKQSFEVKF